jgi:hypothetical protein
MLPIKFRFIWQSGFKENDFLEINQSETRIAFDDKQMNDLPFFTIFKVITTTTSVDGLV